jgi:uncharacterized protein YfdQ (DUF2303 family)
MFNKDAIQSLQEAAAIDQAAGSIQLALDGARGAAALPEHFKLLDVEPFMPFRRRARGAMETSSIEDFAAYVNQHQEPGAMVFVSPSMVANAVLNLGVPAAPGHADNRAKFVPRATAAYLALRKVATGGALDQQVVAEFLEDWSDSVECFHEGEKLAVNKAVAAVRNITIEALRKVEASEQQLSASRTAFESVKASSKDSLPTIIYFHCMPYQDFETRTFAMRLGIRSTDKPAITLRIMANERHEEEMAQELRVRVTDAVNKAAVPVLVGDYCAGK